MRLVPATLTLTLVFTGLGFLFSAFDLGAGFLLVLAALGPNALWWVPMYAALALPAALLGGTLLAASAWGDAHDRPAPADVGRLTLVVTMCSALLLGWVIPHGNRTMSAAMSRFNERAVEQPREFPTSFDLPRLLAEPSPEARAELVRRGQLVALCLLLGAIAAMLVAIPIVWHPGVALGLSLLVFVWQLRSLLSRYAQP